MTFHLESGSQVDRYRGILRGEATLVQEKVIPPRETVWSDVKVSSTGQYPLGPIPQGGEIQAILIKDRNNHLIGQGAFEESIDIVSPRLTVRVIRKDHLGILKINE